MPDDRIFNKLAVILLVVDMFFALSCRRQRLCKSPRRRRHMEDESAIDSMASLIGQTLYSKEGKMIHPMLPGKESYGISLQI